MCARVYQLCMDVEGVICDMRMNMRLYRRVCVCCIYGYVDVHIYVSEVCLCTCAYVLLHSRICIYCIRMHIRMCVFVCTCVVAMLAAFPQCDLEDALGEVCMGVMCVCARVCVSCRVYLQILFSLASFFREYFAWQVCVVYIAAMD